MNMLVKEAQPALRAAVRMTERVCSLPAVATQDWCDLAAAALLPIDQAGIAVVVIGQIDEHGVFIKSEATGVAGVHTAEVTTTVGRPVTATNLVELDANDATLTRVRGAMAQARELSWGPGTLAVGAARVTSIDRTHPSASAPTGVLRRWDGVKLGGLVLAAAGIGPDRRMLAAEVGLIGGTTAQLEQLTSAIEAVAPSLARRAVMAIGTELTDGSQWLTIREQAILKHLLLGKSVKDIAEELGRSPHTVHDHVKSLHKKLNAKSRGQLVARALGHVEPSPVQVVAKPQASQPEKTGASGNG
ncbi:MAG: response regulator transcription factor [Phycisphaerales bacterium]